MVIRAITKFPYIQHYSATVVPHIQPFRFILNYRVNPLNITPTLGTNQITKLVSYCAYNSVIMLYSWRMQVFISLFIILTY